MSREEFARKYFGTHTELSALTRLEEGQKHRSLIGSHPEDKNIPYRGKIPGKNLIEKKCFKDREDNFKNYLLDAVAVRNKEILNKEEMPFKDLLNFATKVLSNKVEGEVNHNFTYADMVMRASKNLEKVHTVDVTNAEQGELVEPTSPEQTG